MRHPADTSFLRASLRWWDAGFYMIVLLNSFAVLVSSELSWGQKGFALMVGVVLSLSYIFIGKQALRSRNQKQAAAYVAILIICVSLITYQTVLGTFLLFLSFSQIWCLSESKRFGILASSAQCLGAASMIFLGQNLTLSDLTELVLQFIIILIFSIGLGLWVTYTLRIVERQSALLAQLNQAQEELVLSHRNEAVALERQHFASEIHDTLAQGFASIVMLTQTIQPTDLADAKSLKSLRLIETTARQNLAEARALVTSFMPSDLMQDKLHQALLRVVSTFEDETGIETEHEVTTSVDALSQEKQAVLLRCLQEGLTNVKKHSGASRAGIEITTNTERQLMVLTVRDNGPQCQKRVVAKKSYLTGFGLRGMRQRALSYGGDVVLESDATQTTLKVSLKL